MCLEDKVEECLTIFGGRSTESGGWMEECREDGGERNVLKGSKLNKM